MTGAKYTQLIQAIEAEFGEPFAEILAGFREMGYSWKTIAGALGLRNYFQLIQLRRYVGLPLDFEQRQFEPGFRGPSPTDRAAQAHGFADAKQAMSVLRGAEGLTCWEAAACLGLPNYQRVSAHTPEEFRDKRLSATGRAKIQRSNARHNRLRKAPAHHPWRGSFKF